VPLHANHTSDIHPLPIYLTMVAFTLQAKTAKMQKDTIVFDIELIWYNEGTLQLD